MRINNIMLLRINNGSLLRMRCEKKCGVTPHKPAHTMHRTTSDVL